MRVVDLRSDTVTHPTPEMRRAMATADVGDDVKGEDPTVNRLEEMTADMLGKEAGMFVSSGTMGNLVSILTHAQRGDEIIVGDKAHVFRAEAGGASALGGIAYHTISNNRHGMVDPDEVEAAIRTSGVHYAKTAVITLENTHNSCGGAVLSPEDIGTIADIARRHNIPVHIDGARIFNAAAYLETPVAALVADADTVSICLSKGLGCPVGSVVCGNNDFIQQARWWRKMVGGGMRQAGVIAAAGVVALETMVERLAVDHSNARKLAQGLAHIDGISIDPDSLPTNLVFFDIVDGDPAELALRLDGMGIKGGSSQRRWRFVTHYGLTSDDIDYTLHAVQATFRDYAKA